MPLGMTRSVSCSSTGNHWKRTLHMRRQARILDEEATLTSTNLARIERLELKRSGVIDVLLSFPVASRAGDDRPLKREGPGSAAWYLERFVVDDAIFTKNGEKRKVFQQKRENTSSRQGDFECPKYFQLGEDMYDINEHDHDPALFETYERALAAKTKGELQLRIIELLLRFMVSRYCGFVPRVFSSADGKELMVAITAPRVMLRAHADEQDYCLQLDERVCMGLLHGVFAKGEILPAWHVYDLDSDMKFRTWHGHSPFKKYHDDFNEGSVFRGIDRIKIVESVFAKYFDIEAMQLHAFVSHHYCPHDKKLQLELGQSWANMRLLNQTSAPLPRIVDYLGEKTGFRMCFLQFLTRAMLPLAITGIIVNFFPDAYYPQTMLGMVLVMWAAVFHGVWKRQEQYWSLAWGMENFIGTENVRPQYYGFWETSTLDRRTLVKVYPIHRHVTRRTVAYVATLLCNLFMIATVLSTFAYRRYLVKKDRPLSAQAVVLLNALQMQLFNWGFSIIAFKLADWENHETDTQYSEAIVQRIFMFRFINSFLSLFYIAFVKHYAEGCVELYGGCEIELASNLRVLCGASMLWSLVSTAWPYLRHRYNALREDANTRSGSYVKMKVAERSYVEQQKELPVYTLEDEVWDEMDVVMELGFVVFFGCVAPEVIALFFVNNLLRLRLWGFKLLFAVRRPSPMGAAGIGMWNKVVSNMTVCAVWCNLSLLIMMHSEGPAERDFFFRIKRFLAGREAETVKRELDWRAMLAAFFVLERALTLTTKAIWTFFSETPESVKRYRKRREYMVNAYNDILMSNSEGVEVAYTYEELSDDFKKVQVLVSGTDEYEPEPQDLTWSPSGDVAGGAGAVSPTPSANDGVNTWAGGARSSGGARMGQAGGGDAAGGGGGGDEAGGFSCVRFGPEGRASTLPDPAFPYETTVRRATSDPPPSAPASAWRRRLATVGVRGKELRKSTLLLPSPMETPRNGDWDTDNARALVPPDGQRAWRHVEDLRGLIEASSNLLDGSTCDIAIRTLEKGDPLFDSGLA